MELNEARRPQDKDHSNDEKDANTTIDYSKQSVNWRYVLPSFLILLGPFLMGCMINAFSADTSVYKRFAKLRNQPNNETVIDAIKSTKTWGGLFPLGGLIGAFLGGALADKCGRKYSTVFLTQFMIIGNVMKVISFSTNIWVFYVARLFDGVASGSLMISCVNWVLEIQPNRIHAITKPLIQILINAGILMMGILLSDFGLEIRWELSYWFPITASALLTLVSFYLPESYSFIYEHTRDEKLARKYLKKARGNGFIEEELTNIVNQVKSSSSIKQMSMMEFLKTRRFLPAIISGIYINLAQQITGINAIASFTKDILQKLQPNTEQNTVQTISTELTTEQTIIKYLDLIILASGLITSIASAPMVSKFRRKLMLIIGFGGMTISLCLTMLLNIWGANRIATGVCLALFFMVFQIGPGPLVWFISAEVFPAETKTVAMSLTTVANWLGNTCVFFLFPIVNEAIGIKSLYIFMGFNALTLIFLSFLMEETLDKTTDEVLENYQKRWHMS